MLHILRQDAGQPTTSEAARREDGVTNPGRMTKRLTTHEKLAMEFRKHKLKYLKEEHEMNMKIFHVELVMKEEEEERNMKQHQCQHCPV